MNTYTVTIKDITAWTTKIRAKGSIEAENAAWKLFQESPNRSAYFEDVSDTTVQVEEIMHPVPNSNPSNESDDQ